MSNSKVTDFYDDYYRSVEVLDELMRRWKAGMKASDVSAAHAMLADYNDLLRQLMKGPPELFEKFSQFVRKQRSTMKPSRSLARLSASCTPTRYQQVIDRLEDGEAKQVILMRNDGIGFSEIAKALKVSLPRTFSLYREAIKQVLQSLEGEDA